MQIDITSEPVPDIFRDRARYRRLAGIFLALSACGVLLGVYAIFSDTPYNETLENGSLGLFAGAALVFAYFGEKLQAYKKLSPEQEKELADLVRAQPEIATYCALVAKSGRQPIQAEFEACQARADELDRQGSLEDP